jgi:hypothetical protein
MTVATMNNYFVRFAFALCLIVTVSSCKTQKKVVAPVAADIKPMVNKSVQDLQDKLDSCSFNSALVTAKANVTIVREGNEMNFNISYRSKKDSVIWISVSPLLGIEVARLMITGDSVKILDKINNKYEVTSFESINKMLQMKVNFEIVQALLYGNFFAYKKNENRFNSVYLEDSLGSQFYILSSLNKKKLKRSLEEKDLNKPVIQDVYVNDTTYRINRVQVEDQRINKLLNTEYSDFRLTDGGLFPFKSKTNITADKNIEIRIEFGKVAKAESLDFPFTIPNNYERIR